MFLQESALTLYFIDSFFYYMRIILLFILFLAEMYAYPVLSQLGFQYDSTIKVKKGNQILHNAWMGGISHPQFSAIDLNGDELEDLFLFDRASNQIRVFLAEENDQQLITYRYAHQWDSLFPQDLRHRATLIDYNNDGLKDLWTAGLAGIKVYRNTTSDNGPLTWELEKDLLVSDYLGLVQHLYVSSIDIPSFVDLDGDTDIDVLTFNAGGERLEFHKNLSIELYGHADSLVFTLENPCYGKFTEASSNNSITLDASSPPCGDQESGITNVQEFEYRHAGTTLLAVHLNNDLAFDLLIGDVDASNITALLSENKPALEKPKMIDEDVFFPSASAPVNLDIMPVPFSIDVDHDGMHDLLFSSNVNGGSENEKGIHYYRNFGTNESPQFNLIQTDFLHENMIDIGRGSIPVLVDLNNDGLQDLLISSNYAYQSYLDKKSSIHYYQNTGDEEIPEFTFITNDWLQLSSKGLGLRLVPSFSDLNGDGRKDLIIGNSNGNLFVSERTGNGVNDFSDQLYPLQNENSETIQVQGFSTPVFFDLDQNGTEDLIIGQRMGGLVYYRNTSSSSASFSLVDDNLGNIQFSSTESFGFPQFYQSNDTIHLLLGTRNGTVSFYENIQDRLNPNASFELTSELFANINTGDHATIAMGGLKANGELDLFVGGELGGIWHYSASKNSDPIVALPSTNKNIPDWKIYPNPSHSGIVSIFSNQPSIKEFSIAIYSILGEKIHEVKCPSSICTVDLSTQKKGVYFIHINSEKIYKLIIR